MTRPDELRRPAETLAVILVEHTDTLDSKARVAAVWTAARMVRSLLPDTVSVPVVADAINVAREVAGYAPFDRTTRRHDAWTRGLAEDLAVRLAWLDDPHTDEAVCEVCDGALTAPRADLAVGPVHCDSCDLPVRAVIPGPVFTPEATA